MSDEWAALVAGASESLVGRHYTEFLPHDARTWGAGLFEAVILRGTAQGSIVVERADGTVLPIEFHAALRGDEIEVVYRHLAD